MELLSFLDQHYCDPPTTTPVTYKISEPLRISIDSDNIETFMCLSTEQFWNTKKSLNDSFPLDGNFLLHENEDTSIVTNISENVDLFEPTNYGFSLLKEPIASVKSIKSGNTLENTPTNECISPDFEKSMKEPLYEPFHVEPDFDEPSTDIFDEFPKIWLHPKIKKQVPYDVYMDFWDNIK